MVTGQLKQRGPGAATQESKPIPDDNQPSICRTISIDTSKYIVLASTILGLKFLQLLLEHVDLSSKLRLTLGKSLVMLRLHSLELILVVRVGVPSTLLGCLVVLEGPLILVLVALLPMSECQVESLAPPP